MYPCTQSRQATNVRTSAQALTRIFFQIALLQVLLCGSQIEDAAQHTITRNRKGTAVITAGALLRPVLDRKYAMTPQPAVIWHTAE